MPIVFNASSVSLIFIRISLFLTNPDVDGRHEMAANYNPSSSLDLCFVDVRCIKADDEG